MSNIKNLLETITSIESNEQLNETTTAGAFATASVQQGDLKKRFEEKETDVEREELDESFPLVFKSSMDRHQWMMQELNKLREKLTPEDSELLNNLIIRFGESEVQDRA